MPTTDEVTLEDAQRSYELALRMRAAGMLGDDRVEMARRMVEDALRARKEAE